MNTGLTIIVLLFCVIVISSVMLIKFWMDFKLATWDRKNGFVSKDNNIKVVKFSSFPKIYKKENLIHKKLYNKSPSRDIIIDCEAEVIKREDYG